MQDETETTPMLSNGSGSSTPTTTPTKQPPGATKKGTHKKVLSWGGAEVMGEKGKPPLPRPTTPKRASSDEAEFHRQNQKFLQQAQSTTNYNSNAASGASSVTSFTSPSPNTKFRKRLQLKAIEEDDGQSLIIKDNNSSNDNDNHNDNQAQSNASTPDRTASTGSVVFHSNAVTSPNTFLPPPPPPLLLDPPPPCSRCIRVQLQDNEPAFDDMSSLGGDYNHYYYSQRSSQHTRNNSNGITPPYTTTSTTALAQFEAEQQAKFQQQKIDLELKLAEALQQHSKDSKEFSAIIQSYMDELENDRAAMISQWKAHLIIEEERIRKENSRKRLWLDCYQAILQPILDPILALYASMELVLSNMPLTIGAVGLGWVTQGTVWFKFTEEMLQSCQHVHYFSDQCSLKEFPGCFQCDPNNFYYQQALKFHYLCSSVAAFACFLFIAKVLLAPQAVLDMLQNPTTSTPAGVFCIAMVCTFAGFYGIVGEIIVLVTSSFHVLLALWFLYMAIFKFRLLPDPGWFPNVVGISYAAVKTWIYYPETGLIIMTLCTVFFLGTFFLSVVRVALNHKIAAPVCWIQLSAPSITLYALTLVSQPTRQQELLEETSIEAKEIHHQFLKTYFLPLHHFFFCLMMVGLMSAIHSLYVRWPTFKDKPFSPAHVAFCFPTLSHTNAIQAYRASLLSLSSLPRESIVYRILFVYWCCFLVGGTILNTWFTIKYIVRIPEWTKPDLSGEEEAPPAPNMTIVHEMMEETYAHETIRQPFVSPAVLEASEAGVLVRVKRGTEEYRRHGPFRRTRNITSLGFDLMLSELELREERARLLDWVAKNAPRKRNRTMSVPGVLHLRNQKDGTDVYGTFGDLSVAETIVRGHTRSKTTTGVV